MSVPISGRLESDRSVAQNHHPAATVHTGIIGFSIISFKIQLGTCKGAAYNPGGWFA